MKGVFQIFFIVIVSNAFSQGLSTLDSLSLLKKERDDTLRYALLIRIAVDEATKGNVIAAMPTARQARRLAYDLGDTAKIVRSSRLVGQIFAALYMSDSVEHLFSKILPIALRHNLRYDYGSMLNYLAVIYTYQSRFDKALTYHFRSLEYRVGQEEIAGSLINIGLAYYKLCDYVKAALYFEQGLAIKRNIKDNREMDRVLINLSLCYAWMDKFDKARYYFNERSKVRANDHSLNIEVESFFAEGIIELKDGDIQKAESSFLQSYRMASKIQDTRFVLENIVCLSQVYIKRQDFKEALKYLVLSERMLKGRHYNLLQLEIYKQYHSLYSHTKDSKRQVDFQTKYIQLRDSIYNEQLTHNLMAIEAEHEQLDNKKRIESQSTLLSIKQDVIDRQENIKLLTYIAAFLLLVLIVTLLTCDLIRKREMVILERKVKERTQELEDTYEVIQKYYSEQTHHLKTTADTIKNCVSTINGLHFLLLNEIAGKNVPEYLQKVEEATSGLSLVSCSFSKVVLDGVGN